MGQTVVLAAVAGPREPKYRSRELFDRAILEVVVRPRVGLPGAEERQLEGHLLRQLEHVVLHKEYPRTQIQVVLQVCSDDGSLAAVAGNAAFLALLDAGVAMRATSLSVTVGVCAGTEEAPATLLLDPTAAEEADCDSLVSLSVDGSRGHLVSSLCSGDSLDALAWAGCAEAGTKATKVLDSFLRLSLQKRLETF